MFYLRSTNRWGHSSYFRSNSGTAVLPVFGAGLHLKDDGNRVGNLIFRCKAGVGKEVGVRAGNIISLPCVGVEVLF